MLKIPLLVVFLAAACAALACDGGADTDRTTTDAEASHPEPRASAPDAEASEPESGSRGLSVLDLRKAEPDPTLPHNRAILDALADPDPFERVARLAEVLPTLGPEAVDQAKHSLAYQVEDQLSLLGVAEYVLLLRFWSRFEPEEAALYASYSSPYGYRPAVTMPLVEEWARREPREVADSVLSALGMPGYPADVSMVGLVRGWFRSGEPGLESFIQQLPVGAPRQRALSIYTRMLIRRDGPQALARWLEGLDDQDRVYKLAAYRQGGIAMAKEAPLAAVAWCDEHCDGPYGEGVRPLVAQHYAARDGLAAMKWLSRVAPGAERDRSVQRAFSGWWQEDSQGLQRWVEEMAADDGQVEPFFQPGLELYAAALARREGESGLRWAMMIEDEKLRHRTLANVGRIWREQDPEAAEAWLETSPLPEHMREGVRDPTKVRVLSPPAPTAQR